MSLNLNGNATRVLYSQSVDTVISASTKISIAISFVPSADVTVPTVFVSEGLTADTLSGFSLKQVNATTCEVAWETSAGQNVYSFSVVSGVKQKLIALYDVSAATISYYVNSASATDIKTSVGSTARGAQKLHLKTGTQIGVTFTIADLTVWSQGAPTAEGITAFMSDVYYNKLFGESGATDKYLFVGNGISTEKLFRNIARSTNDMVLITDPAGGVESVTGAYLVPAADVPMQMCSQKTDYLEPVETLINRGHNARIKYRVQNTNTLLDFDGVNDPAKFYNPLTGVYTVPTDFLPSQYASTGDSVIAFENFARNLGINPSYFTGTWVIKWKGNAIFRVGDMSETLRQPNRLEVNITGSNARFQISVSDAFAGMWFSDMVICRKDWESAIDSGRVLEPQTSGYYGRYDYLNTAGYANASDAYISKYIDHMPRNSLSHAKSLSPNFMIRMALETDTKLWFHIPLFLGSNFDNHPKNTTDGTLWSNFGQASFASLNQANIDEYATKFVHDLNELGYPLDKELVLDAGYYIDSVNMARRAWYYTEGFGLALGYTQGNAYSGYGYLAVRLHNAFAKALQLGGRATQVVRHLYGAHPTIPSRTGQSLLAAVNYYNSLSTFDRFIQLSDLKLSSRTLYSGTYNSGSTALFGSDITANNNIQYRDLFITLAANNTPALDKYITSSQLASLKTYYVDDAIAQLAEANTRCGITGPIYNAIGGSSNGGSISPDFSSSNTFTRTPLIGKTKLTVVPANVTTGTDSVFSVPSVTASADHRIYYPPTSSGNAVTPVLASGNPTGVFTIAGNTGTFPVYLLNLNTMKARTITITITAGVATVASSAEVNISLIRDYIAEYNAGALPSMLYKAQYEHAGFGSRWANASVAIAFGAASNGGFSPIPLAQTHAGLATTQPSIATSAYLEAYEDPATVWSDYQTYMGTYTQPHVEIDYIDIDDVTIRATHELILTSTESVIRTAGSIFATDDFIGVNFEGAEFFYLAEDAGVEYVPNVDSNGDFTGFFDISGSSSGTTTMYVHDVVNGDWYEIGVVTSGSALNFTVNNAMNVVPSDSLYLTGQVFGVAGTTVSGTDLEFSNDGGSTWGASKTIVTGMTYYRRSVTANADPDIAEGFTIAISDGATTHTSSAYVVTRASTPMYYENATFEFVYAENTTTAVANLAAIGDSAITYELSGTDADKFSIDVNTGIITPVGIHNFENPNDADNNGIYQFTVTATSGGDTDSMTVTATLTDVAEHNFAYAGITDVVDAVPNTAMTRTSQLTGGVAGQPFSVVGMTSSNDNGATYSSSTKNYVAGQTFIRFAFTTPNAYETTDNISGTITWSSGSETADVSFDVYTKDALVPVNMTPTFSVNHPELTTLVNVNIAATAGDGTLTYAITGGADSSSFTINTNTGYLSWIAAPSFDTTDPVDNEYVVVVTATNTDGFSTYNDTTTVTITVTSDSLLATDLPDTTVGLIRLSDGTWTTNPGFELSVIGSPAGAGSNGVVAYHDVVRFVKYPKARTVTIASVNSVTNGTALSVFSNQYLAIRPDSVDDMSVSLTVEDDLGNEATFNYQVSVD